MPKKKTHEDYVERLTRIAPDVEVLEEYVNADTKILHKCKKCGNIWNVKPCSIIAGYRCPKCCYNHKKNTEEYQQDLFNKNPNISVIEEYQLSNIPILHKCKICEFEWKTRPNTILTKPVCPQCEKHKKLTTKKNNYINELQKKHPEITLVDTYVNTITPILHRCEKGHEWKKTPREVLNSQGCPICIKRKISHEQYIAKIKIIHPNIEVLETYINSNTAILHRCKKDGYTWKIRPSDIIHLGIKCPCCYGKVIGPAPKYKNSIWASEHKAFFSQYLTKEQMKTYTPHSEKLIQVKCPQCHEIVQTTPKLIYNYGHLSCMCQDGKSYPNKFMCAVIKQLNIDFIIEYCPKWSNRKRYDIYIPKLNCIIENHGKQHYEAVFKNFGITLEDEQKNDKYKKELAFNNNVEYYIEIDCRNSKWEWIKNSIMNSELPSLLSFKETDIDWIKCDEFATNSLMVEVAKLWNQNYSLQDITNTIPLAKSTIRRYLKKATEKNWCNYNPQLEQKKAILRRTEKFQNRIDYSLFDELYEQWQNKNINQKKMRQQLGVGNRTLAQMIQNKQEQSKII